jgi:hypothetical protein
MICFLKFLNPNGGLGDRRSGVTILLAKWVYGREAGRVVLMHD